MHGLAPYQARATAPIAVGINFTELLVDTFSEYPLTELTELRAMLASYQCISPGLIFHYTIKINMYRTFAVIRLGIHCVIWYRD